MYNDLQLQETLDKFDTLLQTYVLYLEDNGYFGTDFDEEAKIDGFKSLFPFFIEPIIEEEAPSEPDAEPIVATDIGFIDFFPQWKADILVEYHKLDTERQEFVGSRKSMTNEVVTKMIAAEKAFGISVDLMDSIFVYRTDLLDLTLIDNEIIEFNETTFVSIIESIEHGTGELKDKELELFKPNWDLIENISITDYYTFVEKKIELVVGLIKALTTDNHEKVTEKKEEIIFIDTTITEILDIITTCVLLVGASPVKRETLLKNYEDGTVQKQIADIFVSNHAGVEEKQVAKTMKASLTQINEENEYEATFVGMLN